MALLAHLRPFVLSALRPEWAPRRELIGWLCREARCSAGSPSRDFSWICIDPSGRANPMESEFSDRLA